MLGGRFTAEEHASILSVWRYTGYLMGIPETVLYTDGASAGRIYRIGFMCEPGPDADSTAMANALINSIPGVANITDPEEKKKVLALAYRLSRAILGNALADQYQYPRSSRDRNAVPVPDETALPAVLQGGGVDQGR